MALPASGPISMDNMNTDRAIPSATQIDLAAAGTAYGVSYLTNGTNDLQFSEFYGLSVPTPTPPSPPPTPPSPPPTPVVYYYNATRCDNSTNYIVYGGGNYYGTGIVVISGGTSYCYTIQNEVGVQSYDDTVGASVADCNDASCYGAPPSPPSPTPPSPTPTPPSPTPTPPPPPTPPYSYLLNNGGEATGPDACNEYNSFVTATYYSNQSSITTGTTLYLSDYVTTVPDGYYSDGTNYWYFGGGVTSDLGTACSPPPPPPPPPTPPSPPPTPPPPPPTPPVCYTFNITNYDAYDTVTGTYTNCGGGSDSFSFTDTSGTSTNIGTICVLDGTTPTITSGNGAASNSLVPC